MSHTVGPVEERATTELSPKRAPAIAWSVAASLLGSFGPALQTWNRSYDKLESPASVLAAGTLLGLALGFRPRSWVRSIAPVAAATALGALLSFPRGGRLPTVLAWGLVAIAHAALVEWQPTARWPRRQVGRAWAAVPLLGVAGVLISDPDRIRWTALVPAAVAMVVVDLTARLPGAARRLDDGLRRLSERARRRSVRLLRSGPTVAAETVGVLPLTRYLRRRLTELRRWLVAPKSRRDRWFLAALGVGVALRTAWVLVMTQPHAEWYSWWNLQAAKDFAQGQTPQYAGAPTNFWPPGYGATLAPLQWIGDRVGGFPIHWAAAGLNIVIGTVVIALTGALATRWFGPGARNPAAWISAVGAGQIFISSAAVPDPLEAMLFLLVVLALTEIVDHRPRRFLPPFAMVGLTIGYAGLVKDFGVVLLAMPALVLRARRGTWRGALRPTLAAAAGAAVLLGGWTIRNGTEIGLWSPLSTVNADGLCWTRYQLDWMTFETEGTQMVSDEMFEDCNKYSPLNVPGAPWSNWLPGRALDSTEPDEARWFSRNTAAFRRFVLDDPMALVRLAPLRMYTTAGNDSSGGLQLAAQSGEITLAGPLAMKVLTDASNLWYYAVVGLAFVGLLRLRPARAALPIWSVALFLLGYTTFGPRALSRHFFVAHPFLAILAGGTVAAATVGGLTLRARAGRDAGTAAEPATEPTDPLTGDALAGDPLTGDAAPTS